MKIYIGEFHENLLCNSKFV